MKTSNKEYLEKLVSGCKNLKEVEKVLKQNKIKYTLFEGILGDEFQVVENDKTYHRIRFLKKKLHITTMVKHTIIVTPEVLRKIDYVQNHCKY